MNMRELEYLWKVATNNPNHDTNWFNPAVIKFAELVAAAEREACAKVCDEIANKPSNVVLGVAVECAEEIRARGEK